MCLEIICFDEVNQKPLTKEQRDSLAKMQPPTGVLASKRHKRKRIQHVKDGRIRRRCSECKKFLYGTYGHGMEKGLESGHFSLYFLCEACTKVWLKEINEGKRSGRNFWTGEGD